MLSRLRQWTDTAEPADGNKIRAAELLGRSVGLFRDVVETTEGKTSDELLSELEAMLESVPDNQPEPEQSEPIPEDRSVH